MAKIKMSQIKHEKVKEYFRNPQANRGMAAKRLKMNSSETLEAGQLLEEEYSREKRRLLQSLVEYADFSDGISKNTFSFFIDKLYDNKLYIKMLDAISLNDLTVEMKRDLIGSMIVSGPNSFEYFFSPESKIDIYSDELDTAAAFQLMFSTKYRNNPEILGGLLNRMSEKNLKSLEKEIKQMGTNHFIELDGFWNNIPEWIFELKWPQAYGIEKHNMAMMKDAPASIKLFMYESTGDTKFLPDTAKEIFLF